MTMDGIYSDDLNEIWATLTSQRDDTFYEFYTSWRLKGYSQTEFLNCAYQNTINYDNLPLSNAVDATTLSWSTGGDTNWSGEFQEYCYDYDAAQSPVISHNQNTWIKTNVTGPGTIKFWWKVSSEFSGDYLRFCIAGEEKNKIDGTNGIWKQEVYPVPPGPQELMWKYTKDADGNSGWDCGWLDKVEWVPGSSNPTIGYSPSTFIFSATQGGSNPSSQTLNIWNSGGATLNWSVTDDANWLSLSPTSGTSTGETDIITISASISGLSTGTYNATITISAPEATNTPQTVPVTLIVNSPSTTTRLIGVDINTTSTGGDGSCTNVILQRFLASATGTITEFKVKASSGGNVKVAIYADSSGQPSSLLAAINSSTPVTSGWNTIPITSTAVISGTYFLLAAVSDSCNIYYHSNDPSANTIWKPSTYSSYTFPNPAGPGWNTQPGYTYFIAGWGTVGP